MRKLNVHDLQKSLNILCNKLSLLFNINDGGCCFIAYLIALHLDKLNLKYRLIILNKYRKNSNNIRDEIFFRIPNKIYEDSVIRNGTCNHYAIYLEGAGAINIDEFDFTYYRYYIKNINSTHIKWIYKTGNWNPIYNINNNKLIRKTFKTFFNDYEKRSCLPTN